MLMLKARNKKDYKTAKKILEGKMLSCNDRKLTIRVRYRHCKNKKLPYMRVI